MPDSPIDSNLLKILACPESHQPLRLLEAAELDKINSLIASGEARTVAGELCVEQWNAGLIRADRLRAYEIQDGLPLLLIESAVELGK